MSESDIRIDELWSVSRQRPLLVTGTDTEVGKTYVTAKLVALLGDRGHRVGAYKPVASGCQLDDSGGLVSDDGLALWEALARREPLDRVCPQRFAAPLAPPAAAALEGRRVDIERMIEGAEWWRQRSEPLIVEGAGGLLSPLADGFSNADLARRLDADVVIVAANRLGVINHTRLTEVAAEALGLRVVAIVLNQAASDPDASTGSNAEALRQYCRAPLVAVLEHNGSLLYSA
jgi:dethiobiotin synthetase